MTNSNSKIGPQSSSDARFTAKCRLHQSEYRLHNLDEEKYGKGPNRNSKTKYGNFLVNGEETGSNFISDSAFKFAKQKVLDKQINRKLTIDDYRLFNNMLSSMPMCFNLFSDLRELLLNNQVEASRVIKLLLKEIDWVDKVTYIDVEFIPVPISDYTNDRSAFDAMLLVEDKEGNKGLISIETKYTDLLGSNSSSKTELKNEIVENNKIFDAELRQELKNKGYQQIHRNYLLTYAFAKKNKCKHFINVVLSPVEDVTSVKEIEEMQGHMPKNKGSITKIPLESFVQRGSECGNELISALLQKFHARYLDFRKV